MQSRDYKPVLTGLLQALLAAGIWLLWGIVFYSIGPGIDFEKPNHQVSLATRLEEATLLMGLPILWSTSAVILLWRRSGLGWWLCFIGDLIMAAGGGAFVITDLWHFSGLKRYPASYPEVLYHLAVLVIPTIAIALLFSRSLRAWAPPLRLDSAEPEA